MDGLLAKVFGGTVTYDSACFYSAQISFSKPPTGPIAIGPVVLLRGRAIVAIYRLIANGLFGPKETEVMTAAYEAALLDLGLVDRDDPITEVVARAIVSVTSRGERDPTTIKNRALKAIGARSFSSTAA